MKHTYDRSGNRIQELPVQELETAKRQSILIVGVTLFTLQRRDLHKIVVGLWSRLFGRGDSVGEEFGIDVGNRVY